jgi:hypothetical protein
MSIEQLEIYRQQLAALDDPDGRAAFLTDKRQHFQQLFDGIEKTCRKPPGSEPVDDQDNCLLLGQGKVCPAKFYFQQLSLGDEELVNREKALLEEEIMVLELQLLN